MATRNPLSTLHSNPCILFPAYGAKYATLEDMHKGWAMGKDFKIKAGPYTSIRDLTLLRNTFSSIWLTNWDGTTMMVG